MPPAPSAPVLEVGEQRQDGLHLALTGTATHRLGDALLGLCEALAQHAFAGLFLAVAVKPSVYDSNPAVGARLLGLALAVAVYAFGRRGRRRMRRAARLGECLTVMPDRLVVRHGALLTNPVTIERRCVDLVAVDEGSPPALGRASLPLLDPLTRPPNLLPRFTEPIDFPARTRRLGQSHRLPGSQELGLKVRVKDPAAAARAFATWGVVRPDDAGRLHPQI